MFDCGITVSFGQMTTQIENGIITAVQRVGIDVDKERLEEVLTDARGNYERGYRAGYEQAMREQDEPKQVVRKQCKTERPDGAVDYFAEWYCPHCNSLLKRGYDAPWIKHCFNCGKPISWGGDAQDA